MVKPHLKEFAVDNIWVIRLQASSPVLLLPAVTSARVKLLKYDYSTRTMFQAVDAKLAALKRAGITGPVDLSCVRMRLWAWGR